MRRNTRHQHTVSPLGTSAVRLTGPVALITAVIGLSLAACGSSANPSSGAARASHGRSTNVGYSSPIGTIPSQQDLFGGLRAGAKAIGWQASVLDANLSADKQVSDIQTFLDQGVKGIVTWTLNPGAVGLAYTQANSRGIPVVGINSAGQGINTNIIWGIYSCVPGGVHQQTARYIAKRIPGAKVLVIGPPPTPSLLTATECFEKYAKQAGLQIVSRTDNLQDTPASAAQIVGDLLTAHPEVNAIWAFDDATALGVSAAVETAKKPVWSGPTRGIIVTGEDAEAPAIQAVRDGRMTLTWDPLQAATGWAAIKAMEPVLRGGMPIKAMPKQLILDSVLYDKSNVDKFVPQNRRSYSLGNLPLVSSGLATSSSS